ncbi:hypothetical protein [Neobacillus sp. LXY-1]|uniref:hypothetical protein n=1 Tax=Neobacillus sp. LXY-1 TaxID=3379133 RepID=UPI003EDE88CF
MKEEKKQNQSTEEANYFLNRKSKNDSERVSPQLSSEAEVANNQIQNQFYEQADEGNSLPFLIDSQNPPIKK